MKFDALMIDFYGTIAAGDHEAVQSTCATIVEALNLPTTPGELAIIWGERFFRTVDVSSHDSFRTLYECELLSLRETLALWDHAPDPAPFVQSLEDYWRNPPVHSDALDLLQAARAHGVPTCIVSNADCDALASAMARHQLKVDHVVVSEAARCYKPEEAIFRQALDLLRLPPSRVLHVGDSLHSDIGGALRAGIPAAWICREKRVHDVGICQPWRTISSLAELSELLFPDEVPMTRPADQLKC